MGVIDYPSLSSLRRSCSYRQTESSIKMEDITVQSMHKMDKAGI